MRQTWRRDVLAALGSALRQAYDHIVLEPLPKPIAAGAADVLAFWREERR